MVCVSPSEIRRRLWGLERAVCSNGVKEVFITDEGNLVYFSGFRGPGALLYQCGVGGQLLVPLMEYWKVSEDLSRWFEVIPVTRHVYNPRSPPHQVEGSISSIILDRILSVDRAAADKRTIVSVVLEKPELRGRLMDVTDSIIWLRRRKSDEEIRYLRMAVKVTERALEHMFGIIRPGATERDLYLKLLSSLYEEGGDGVGFDPIVAVDENTANPHALPGGRRVRRNSVVLIDVGARVCNYTADMTRTLVPSGTVWESLRENIIQAMDEALNHYRAGEEVSLAEIAARRRLLLRGKHEYFIHSLGHGVGVEVHEPPFISISSKYRFIDGDVVTVEPGVYFPFKGGIRVENMVHISGGKPRVLNELPVDTNLYL